MFEFHYIHLSRTMRRTCLFNSTSGMLIWLTVSFCVTTCKFASAQSSARDSLKAELQHHNSKDTTYILLLCEYANSFDALSYDSVLSHSKEAYKLAREQNFDRGIGFSLWLIGMSYYYLDRIDSAQINLDRALPFAQKSGDLGVEARVYNSMANVARYLGQRALALDFYFQSLRLKEAQKDLNGSAITLNNIANVYAELGDWEQAWPYFYRSLAIRRKISREHTSLMLLSDIGENHLRLRNIDSALYYLQRALGFASASQDPWSKIHVYQGLIEYYSVVDNIDSAMHFAVLGVQLARTANSKDREAVFLLEQGRLLNSSQQFTASLDVLDVAIPMARAVKRMDYARDGEKIRSDALFGLGRFKEAYESFKNYKILSDSMQSRSILETLRAKELEYELYKQKLKAESERASFSESKKWSTTLLWLIMSMTFFIGFVAVMLYRIVRERTKANQNLKLKQEIIEAQNEEILSQNDELIGQKEQISLTNQRLEEEVMRRTKELYETINQLTEQNEGLGQFSYIVSHNLRAPLARIKGLVALIKMTDGDQQQTSEYLRLLELSTTQLEDVIKDLSLIVSLRKSFDLTRESIEVRATIDSVVSLLESDLRNAGAKVNINLGGFTQIHAVRQFLHSIFLNLISNSIKYRSPRRHLELTIEAHMEGSMCHFAIRDNGIGIPLDEHTSKKIFGLYNRFHPSIEGKGFGLYLVKTQLELMGGSISVTSQMTTGSVFRFDIPNEIEHNNLEK
ncbi:MAG: tetratricopeptide repeat-containing sensor histidine kinase [Imperialibacter sp.]